MKCSASINFQPRHAIGRRLPDGMVGLEVNRGQQPPTWSAKYGNGPFPNGRTVEDMTT